MTIFRTLALATLVAAGTATAVDAEPFGAPAPIAAGRVTPVFYGYGPPPYGFYGPRRRFRRPNDTGYYGRGTRTGGPSGGLPGRS